MTNYTKTTNFATKDTLPSGNANKIVKGTEIDTEFNNIATAVATKADTAGPTFTGTVTIPTVDLNGGAIDGTTVGASTAAAITGTTIVANTSINIAGDGATVTGIKDEDDMSSNSATKLATQQSIKAYVDSQVTAQDLDFQADSGGALSIDLDSETLTFTGGTGVDTSGSGNAVTFAIDSTVATLTGTQTLTNKTLTSPTLNTPTIGTSFTIGSATITEAELEILDGATVTTAELNVLDGITSTTAELNILDGVTSTAAELNILDGVTSTAAELNILDGVTSTTAELNILDGVTATTAELNYVDGVTSAIQTQLDAKAALSGANFTGAIDVTGTVTADGLTVDGSTTLNTSSTLFANLNYSGSNLGKFSTDGVNLNIEATNNLFLKVNSATRAKFDGNGDISFYEDTGTTAKLFWDASAESLGIGVTPSFKFHVKDTFSALAFEHSGGNAVLKIDGGNGDLSGSDFSSITDIGGTLLFGTNGGSEVMRIDSSGNVGIGTSSASGALHVSRSGLEAGITLERTSSATAKFTIAANDGNLTFTDAANSAERMRIDSSGNVGIGESSPAEKLEVAGNILLNASNAEVNLRSGATGTSGAINWTFNTDTSNFASIKLAYDDRNTTGLHIDSGYPITLDASGIGTIFAQSGSEKARIDSSGNLLVGKTVTSLLTAGIALNSNGAIYATADAERPLILNRETSDGSIAEFRKDNTAVGSIGVENSDRLFIDSGSGNTGIRFDGAAWIPRDNGSVSDGGVDVGSSGARLKDLYLSGTINLGTKITATGVTTTANAWKSTSDSTSSSKHMLFANPNGNVGDIRTNGSATAYITSSDYRLKENVVAMSGATERLKQLKPSRFNFIADADTTVDGFLAHEVEDIVPEAIAGEKDAMMDEEYEVTPAVYDDDGNVVTEAVMGTRSVPDYQGIDQSKLVPLLVATIQELEARITQLESN